MTRRATFMRMVVRYAVRPVLSPTVPVARQRRRLDLLGRPGSLPRGTRFTAGELGGRPALRVSPAVATGEGAILFLHGGGYTVGSATTHRAVAAHLAAAAGVPVHLLDYRLAPEHRSPSAVDDAVAAYEDLLASGIPGDQLAVAGDSAGGGLTLALTFRLKALGLPLPGALGLMSPWVDLSLAGVRDDPRDPMLTSAWLRACASRYAGPGSDLRDPTVSPLYGDLAGLPPTIVQAGSDEILLPDIERLVVRLDDAAVPVTYQRLQGLWHVSQLQAGTVPEATAAVRELGRFLDTHVGRELRSS